MRRERQVRSDAIRVNSALARVRRLIDLELVHHSGRMYELLLVGGSKHYEAARNAVEGALVERDFAAVRRLLPDFRQTAVTPNQIAWAIVCEAHLESLAGHARAAVALARDAIRRDRNDGDLRARVFATAGLACYRAGHYGWAKSYLEQAAGHYRITRQNGNLLRTLVSLSLVLKSRGDLQGALWQLDEATRLLPRRGFARSRLRIHVNRGICLLKLGRIAAARASFMQAHTSAALEADAFLSVSVLNNLGHVFRIEGNTRLAIEFHTKALETARAIESDRQACLALEFLGECHLSDGRPDAALDVLNEAHSMARKIAGHGDLRMEILRRRGEAFSILGRREEAALDLEHCAQLCKSRGERRELILARRARLFVDEWEPTAFVAEAESILGALYEIGDRCEYVQTFVALCGAVQKRVAGCAWLRDAHATAQYFAREMDIPLWVERVRRVAFDVAAAPDPPRGGAAVLAESTRSWAFERALEAARVAARGRLPVLIVGETGVGKEVFASQVHRWSDRAAKPLVAINCGALPEALVESELFGHVRGAYTGADRDKQGLLSAADGGAVLLDEIADLPMVAQVKLLRFLDSGEIRRVGETQSRHYDVRVFASTNKPIEMLAEGGRFREDLLYRLKGFVVEVPPLRERREDILPLARALLREAAQSTLPTELSPELQAWLMEYSWPGNIRELRNLCGYLVARAWGERHIDVVHLPGQLASRNPVPGHSAVSPQYGNERSDLERWQIERALRTTGGGIRAAAAILGMGRNTLARRIRAHGLDPAHFHRREQRL